MNRNLKLKLVVFIAFDFFPILAFNLFLRKNLLNFLYYSEKIISKTFHQMNPN
jgi:hypothetical protein